jgi:hypothetical protein
VVVSDDTGLPGRDNHAPWLFTMDERGRVDEQPLRIEGLTSVNDLESIASTGRDGALLVLSSQSMSKKGKRRPDRQRMLRLVPAGKGYRVAGSTELATQLDALGASELAALGLEQTVALNIEGMSATAEGGVLIGLKAPLDREGRALIWQMRTPERFLASGRLADAELRLRARVKLEVTAEGRTVPGGIAELLELPDGALLISATASALKTARQDGSLWRAASLGAPGEALAARRVQSFPGRKPEGLALSPRAKQIAIVFDADAGAPEWLELPWPRD